jgi:NADH:ubiquinone oxidoreductase subunit F (NADH-binding)
VAARALGDRYEVRAIALGGETPLMTFSNLDAAFDDCLARWAGRKTGSSIYAVRDTRTEQRWSYTDIKNLRSTQERCRCGWCSFCRSEGGEP